MNSSHTVSVLGAGSWGTALAILLARNGHRTRLWGRRPNAIEEMASRGENTRYLPGMRFPHGLEPCGDADSALNDADLVVIAIPSKNFRTALTKLIAHVRQKFPPVVWATKGLETATGKWLHEVVREELGADLLKAVISGPSFAREVALGLPTAVTVASEDKGFAQQAAAWFHGDTFRVYTSQDMIGVELGGALKNVLAIAAGISDGLGYGANARAALITRGLHEIMQLGERAGARRETLMGLSGLGDLLLTCTDDQSRNRRLGLAIGDGQAMSAATEAIGQAVEGAETAKVVMRLAATMAVEMPICAQVYRVLYEGLDPSTAVTELLARELKNEI